MLEINFHHLVSSTQGASFSVTELVHAANRILNSTVLYIRPLKDNGSIMYVLGEQAGTAGGYWELFEAQEWRLAHQQDWNLNTK
jgi:hypothetical protein